MSRYSTEYDHFAPEVPPRHLPSSETFFAILAATHRRMRGIGHTIRHRIARVGRNEPCPCGCGMKFKHCPARKK